MKLGTNAVGVPVYKGDLVAHKNKPSEPLGFAMSLGWIRTEDTNEELEGYSILVSQWFSKQKYGFISREDVVPYSASRQQEAS